MAMLAIVMAVQASVSTRPTAYTILRVMMPRSLMSLRDGDVKVLRGGVAGRTGVRDYCVAIAGWVMNNGCFRFGDDRLGKVTQAEGKRRGARHFGMPSAVCKSSRILESLPERCRLQSGGAQMHAGSNM